MKSMEVNVGVIRDKPGIYTGLWQSQSSNQQLAICYSSEGKLIVKIGTVKEMTGQGAESQVTFTCPENDKAETTIPVDSIVSIYPIRDFDK